MCGNNTIPAITLQATGLTDLEISGPVAAGSDSTDTTEPYSWLPGSLITYTGGLTQWITDFKAAYASDNTLRATMVLDDGVLVAGHIQAAAATGVPVAAAQVRVTPPLAARVQSTAATGVPAAAARVRTAAPPTPPARIRAVTTTGAPVVSATVRTSAPTAGPDAPTMLAVAEADYTTLLIQWQAPSDGGSPITNYEYRIEAGPRGPAPAPPQPAC